MLDFRVKRPKSAVNWRYQEIVVTAGYLTATVDDPNLVELDSRYEMGGTNSLGLSNPLKYNEDKRDYNVILNITYSF